MLFLALVWQDNVEPPEQAEEGQSHALFWSVQIRAARELNLVDQHLERTWANSRDTVQSLLQLPRQCLGDSGTGMATQ